ncbi:hypothetical protein, partial [Actinoplanes sp. NPDC049802]|uniref:hypothetical protein n=1 Tax=Actinoplanes sp. NPDC049802 TaxID=3154742 RepID=UPI0033C0D9DB
EDADLGMRLARSGHRVGVLRSVTLEEAPRQPSAAGAGTGRGNLPLPGCRGFAGQRERRHPPRV